MGLIVHITGTRRGLGKYLSERMETTPYLEECDVFINCKHNHFEQVDNLYRAAEFPGIKIINLGSISGDLNLFNKPQSKYGLEKIALEQANKQLFWQGVDTTLLKLGFFDSEAVSHLNVPKLSLQEVYETIGYILNSRHRIESITLVHDEFLKGSGINQWKDREDIAP